jgi:hypothetical protein
MRLARLLWRLLVNRWRWYRLPRDVRIAATEHRAAAADVRRLEAFIAEVDRLRERVEHDRP